MSGRAQAGTVDEATVDEFRRALSGEVIRPFHDGYDEHRKVWNGSIDRRPG